MEELIIEAKKGTVLFKEGDKTQDMYVVREGVVKIYKTSNDNKLLPLGLVHSGQFVGEMSFFDGQPRSATAETVTDCKLLKLDKPKLEKEMSKLPSWLLVLIRSIAQRVRDADDLVKRNGIVDTTMSDEFKRWD